MAADKLQGSKVQALHTLAPMSKLAAGKGDPDDPAQLEYMEAKRFLDRGEYAQAAMGFHNALCAYEERGDKRGVANSADRLGDACVGREEYAMALANYERALVICEEVDDVFSLSALNKKMARCQWKLGQRDKSLAILDNMLEHYRMTKNPKGAVDTLELMAELYAEGGDRANAADALRAAASIHKNFKHAATAADFLRRAEMLEQGQ